MLDRQHTQTITVGDVSVAASISPCCWMYPGHGLQIRVALPNGGSAYVHDAAKPFDQSCEADIDRLLKQVRVIPCSRCGGQAFDPASVVTNPPAWLPIVMVYVRAASCPIWMPSLPRQRSRSKRKSQSWKPR